MPTGTIKWFDQDRQYGFIVPDGPGPELFVHFNDLGCYPNLKKGEAVHYQMGRNKKGLCAVDVRLIEKGGM